MNTLKHIEKLLIAAFACIGINAAMASSPSIKVNLDSAYLLMGKTTPLHVEVVNDVSAKGLILIPKDSVCDKVEILQVLNADTTEVGSGRQEVKLDIILQSFDSGMYRINPIKYVEGNETILSNQPVLKVLPVSVDTLQTIHDYADVADIDRSFIDYLPDFVVDYGLWILAIIIALGVTAYVIYFVTKKKNPFAPAPQKPIPPYEKALQELAQLRAEKLCEQGKERDFYTRLTDILRVYLHGRFGINAMEMASTQIRHTLQANEETRLSKKNMEQVLETADFVKFAKVRPLPDDNVKAFNSAMQFIEDTKPQPNPETESDVDGAETETNETNKK